TSPSTTAQAEGAELYLIAVPLASGAGAPSFGGHCARSLHRSGSPRGSLRDQVSRFARNLPSDAIAGVSVRAWSAVSAEVGATGGAGRVLCGREWAVGGSVRPTPRARAVQRRMLRARVRARVRRFRARR